MISEFDLIERYFAHLAAGGPDVLRGVGDDCAVLRIPDGQVLAVSVDTLVEGVHYPRDTAPEDIGWKALACGLSDLAAAGADPAWCTLALTLPAADEYWLAGFAAGFAELARAHGVALVGGDTTRGQSTTISVQVAGHLPAGRERGRDGARPGDWLWISGWPGEAAAGLAQLQERAVTIDERLLAHLNRPVPRVALGQRLRGFATACIDVSDGLAADAAHIAAASGVGITIEVECLPVSPALANMNRDRVRDWMLAGGDDYELCFTLPADQAPDPTGLGVPLTPIGVVDAGGGVSLRDADGRSTPVGASGYRHFGD